MMYVVVILILVLVSIVSKRIGNKLETLAVDNCNNVQRHHLFLIHMCTLLFVMNVAYTLFLIIFGKE